MRETSRDLFRTVPGLRQSAPAADGDGMVVQVRGLTKTYGKRSHDAAEEALRGVDLDVQAGDFLSIMGPSGSGKTTLLNLLAGLDRPTGGQIRIQGHDIAQLSAEQLAIFRRRQLGFVFQDFNLLDTLTLLENVALPLTLDGGRGREVRGRARAALAALGLEPYLERYPYEVSGGQQQRAAIARAIVHEPVLVLADEPTGNLDSTSARVLLGIFQQINRERGTTVVMVTHDPFSASYGRRVVFLKDGRVCDHLDRSGSQRQFFEAILDRLARLEPADVVA